MCFRDGDHRRCACFPRPVSAWAQIYEVDVNDNLPRHTGNFEAITRPTNGAPYVASFAEMAVSYWRDTPVAPGLVEILIDGRVTILGIAV